MKRVFLLLFCLTSLASAGTPEPAISMASFLRMKPQLNNAEPSIADNKLDLLFAPQGDFEAQIIYRNGRQIIDQLTAKPSQRYGNMARLKWKRKTIPLGTESGPRSIEVLLGGKSVGKLDFTLTKSASSDPYDPKVSWLLGGPWSDLAYFTYPADDRNQQRINFHYWSNRGDLGGAKGMIDVVMKRGNKVMGKTRSSEASYDFYLHRDMPLKTPKGKPVMLPDLQALNGPFVIELSHKGKVIKRFRGTIQNGKFKAHPRSVLNFQPRNQFLGARTLNEGGGQLDSLYYIWLIKD